MCGISASRSSRLKHWGSGSMSPQSDKVRAAAQSDHAPCPTCKFELWNPIGALHVSQVGLYDDARFPGRLIVSLNAHFDHLDDLPADLVLRFMTDVQLVSQVLRDTLQIDRVNLAILGNQERHIHAHLVPRLRIAEPLPDKAPWEDPRPRQPLHPADRASLMNDLAQCLEALPQPKGRFGGVVANGWHVLGVNKDSRLRWAARPQSLSLGVGRVWPNLVSTLTSRRWAR